MIQEILSKGFDGLYINRDAYEEPEWTALGKECAGIYRCDTGCK